MNQTEKGNPPDTLNMRLFFSESKLTEIWNVAKTGESVPPTFSPEHQTLFEHYRSIHQALVRSALAPQRAIDLAKSIMPVTTHKFRIAQLIRPNLALGFARGAVSQVQFESDGLQVRIQMEELPHGWRIWGRASESGWSIWSGNSSQTCDGNGDFFFETNSQSVEPLTLQNESVIILLPMSDHESGDGDS